MKLLSVIENYPPYIVGGAEITLQGYLEYYHQYFGLKYLVITGRHTQQADAMNQNIQRVLRAVNDEVLHPVVRIRDTVWNLLYFCILLCRFRPTVIEFVPNNFSLFPLIAICLITRQRVLISVHSNCFETEVKSIGNWVNFLRKEIVSGVNRSPNAQIMTISQFMRDRLVKLGFSPEKTSFVYNPLNKFVGSGRRLPYAVFASRLVKEKGVSEILEAFSRLPFMDLYVFGEGNERKLVDEYVKKYKNIHYFGKVTEDQVAESIKNAYCIVSHPIYDEPFGRYIIHSFQFLKPLISSYSGAVPELIQNEQTGLLVRKGDIDGIAEAVTRLYNNQQLYQTILRGIEKKRTTLSIAAAAEKKWQLIVEIAGEGKKSR